MTSGVSSQGTTLGYGNGASPETFTTVANCTSIDGPSADNPEIDVTALNSTAKEYLAGFQDFGEVSGDINYDPANSSHAQIRTDQAARTIRHWRITFPTSPAVKWTFSAFVKSFKVAAGVDQPLKGSLVLRATGPITVS